MNTAPRWLLQQATGILFLCVLVLFGSLTPHFLSSTNLVNILIQASSTAVVATGMTFVLLTAGVDLSVGAMMFLAAAIGGKWILAGGSLPFTLMLIVLTATAGGVVNGALVAGLRIVPFVATLGMLFAARGLGLWTTETRAMNLPESFLQIGTTRWLHIPLPLWILAVVVIGSHLVLTRTPFGRHIYAVGHDRAAAAKAGLPVRRILASVYGVCGFCVGIGAILSLAQLGAVSPSFGEKREFTAIAAAVLGGTSLFGGRGHVLPGTLLGAVLIQCVENGLVLLDANPYLYPIITSAIIFMAVLLDSLRNRLLNRLNRRTIYIIETVSSGAGSRSSPSSSSNSHPSS